MKKCFFYQQDCQKNLKISSSFLKSQVFLSILSIKFKLRLNNVLNSIKILKNIVMRLNKNNKQIIKRHQIYLKFVLDFCV